MCKNLLDTKKKRKCFLLVIVICYLKYVHCMCTVTSEQKKEAHNAPQWVNVCHVLKVSSPPYCCTLNCTVIVLIALFLVPLLPSILNSSVICSTIDKDGKPFILENPSTVFVGQQFIHLTRIQQKLGLLEWRHLTE